MNRSVVMQVVGFMVYLFLQVLIFKNVVLFHTAFCFVYVAYLLLLPVDKPSMSRLGIGFLMGFFIDIFYDSLGMHALACVFIMYGRNFWLNLITPQGGYDSNTIPSITLGGISWFVMYSAPIIFIHHALLFYIEAGGFGLFWFTLWKAITSSLFTLLVIIIIQYLFPNKRRV